MSSLYRIDIVLSNLVNLIEYHAVLMDCRCWETSAHPSVTSLNRLSLSQLNLVVMKFKDYLIQGFKKFADYSDRRFVFITIISKIRFTLIVVLFNGMYLFLHVTYVSAFSLRLQI